MSWRATLDGTQVKHFKAALNCFNKIGSELLIEAVPSKLKNTSVLDHGETQDWQLIISQMGVLSQHGDSNDMSLKLTKHALALFRTQRISKLVLELDVKVKEQLVATVVSESGLQKEYTIPCIDTEILQATVDRDTLPTHVIASAKELHRLLSSFQANLEEITVIALPETMHDGRSANAVQLHSYLDPCRRQAASALHTQISVNTEALFSSFQHTGDEAADVTFNLRDFRVMLAWCMTMDMDMAIRFQAPGAPLLVEPHIAHGEMDVEAQLVLATLLESQAHRAYSTRRGPQIGAHTNIKTYFKTPGVGTTPHVPGDTPAVTGNRTGIGRTGRPEGNQARGRSRFAPENQRQPDFETPGRQFAEPNTAPRAQARAQASALPTERQSAEDARHGDTPMDDALEGRGNEGGELAVLAKGASRKQRSYFGSLQNGMQANESFEDDDLEDNRPSPLRSRFDPRGMADDDEDDDEDAIPGTP